MHHAYLDHMAYQTSPIHVLDPRAKLAATVVFAVAVTVSPTGNLVRLAALFCLLAPVVCLSTVPISYVLKRAALVLPFVGVVAAAAPFVTPGTAIWSVVLFGWTLTASKAGLLLAASMVIKAALVAVGLLTLAATTRFPQLLAALKWYRLPSVFVMLLSFLYRYLFLVIDQAHHMRLARRSRCPRARPKGGLRSSASMLASLTVRSFDRAERVHHAMVSRGHDGEIRILQALVGRRVHYLQCAAFASASLLFALLGWPEFLSWTP